MFCKKKFNVLKYLLSAIILSFLQISITREHSQTLTYNLSLTSKYRLFLAGKFFSVIHCLFFNYYNFSNDVANNKDAALHVHFGIFYTRLVNTKYIFDMGNFLHENECIL